MSARKNVFHVTKNFFLFTQSSPKASSQREEEPAYAVKFCQKPKKRRPSLLTTYTTDGAVYLTLLKSSIEVWGKSLKFCVLVAFSWNLVEFFSIGVIKPHFLHKRQSPPTIKEPFFLRLFLSFTQTL